MAMTGMRRMTTGLGLVREPPPDAILRQGFPSLFALIPVENRDEAIELAHWAYGAVGGALFGSLPAALRRQVWAGPAYGFAVWLAFEGALAPLLGINPPSDRKIVERMAVAADHLLYGAIVGDRAVRS
jgi:hypothetical protein